MPIAQGFQERLLRLGRAADVARARADIGLSAKIHEIHRRSRGAYGAPNIHAELADDVRAKSKARRAMRRISEVVYT